MIKALIIDDQSHFQEIISALLREYFPEINIVGYAEAVEDGIKKIEALKPNLVFLDIELKGGSGFHILQKIKERNFKVIFVTAFDNFAIRAIKFSALDYILKPINEFEFKNAVENALEVIEGTEIEEQINNFISHYEKRTQSKKIILKTVDTIHLIDIANIIYAKSDSSYTTFCIEGEDDDIMVSKSIKEYEQLLGDYRFLRPHQSYLVNLNQVQRIDKKDGGFLILKNGIVIPISSRRKNKLLQILEKL
jgi:two-component system LytT family response regulator